MDNTITPELLAKFIEYAATDRVTTQEWNRFAVTHYQDEQLEQARSECVRLILERDNTNPMSPEAVSRLLELADSLRKARQSECQQL